MTTLTLTPDTLVLELGGADRVLSLKSRLTVPLTAIGEAAVVERARIDPLRAIRAPGTHLPGVVASGTFYTRGRRVFANIREGRPALVLRLRGHRYHELIVRTDDVEADLARVRTALAGVTS